MMSCSRSQGTEVTIVTGDVFKTGFYDNIMMCTMVVPLYSKVFKPFNAKVP